MTLREVPLDEISLELPGEVSGATAVDVDDPLVVIEERGEGPAILNASTIGRIETSKG